jgi:hypothetical protein
LRPTPQPQSPDPRQHHGAKHTHVINQQDPIKALWIATGRTGATPIAVVDRNRALISACTDPDQLKKWTVFDALRVT